MSERLEVKPGDRYGRLTICREAESQKWKRCFLCRCECGAEVVVRLEYLRSGHTKSCGCYLGDVNRKLRYTHGGAGTRLYKIWLGMKKRCNNPGSQSFHNYGGRGIKVCREWNDFSSFLAWVKKTGYDDTLTIERIDVNGNYEPSNCRWATRKEQSNNTRKNKLITFGETTKNISGWADCLGLPYNVLQLRLSRGWSVEKALTAPVRQAAND